MHKSSSVSRSTGVVRDRPLLSRDSTCPREDCVWHGGPGDGIATVVTSWELTGLFTLCNPTSTKLRSVTLAGLRGYDEPDVVPGVISSLAPPGQSCRLVEHRSLACLNSADSPTMRLLRDSHADSVSVSKSVNFFLSHEMLGPHRVITLFGVFAQHKLLPHTKNCEKQMLRWAIGDRPIKVHPRTVERLMRLGNRRALTC